MNGRESSSAGGRGRKRNTDSYDAVGNILNIGRVNVANLPGAVGISLFSPTAGGLGATIEIFGKGFSATPAQNTVNFNGSAATVLDSPRIAEAYLGEEDY
jgi:hypothetical protein